MREHVVSFFSSVEQLESLVGVGVAAARLTRQVAINRIGPGNPLQGDVATPDSSYAQGILDVVREQASERVITIDVANGWWSTRLYLLAFLLQRFTAAQRILVVAGGSFVGLLPLDPVIRVIGRMHAELAGFEEAVRQRSAEPDVLREAEALVELFAAEFGAPAKRSEKERAVMYNVAEANLARWFPDALLNNPLRLARVDPASPLDLVRPDHGPRARPRTQSRTPVRAGRRSCRLDVLHELRLAVPGGQPARGVLAPLRVHLRPRRTGVPPPRPAIGAGSRWCGLPHRELLGPRGPAATPRTLPKRRWPASR